MCFNGLSCAPEQRERFLEGAGTCLEKSETEQRLKLRGHGYIHSVEEYWQYRHGTSGVPLMLSLNE